MGLPPSLQNFRPPADPQTLAVEELRQVNEYLEVLIEMFAGAFPDAVPEDLKLKIQEMSKSRRQIGFQTDE